MKRMKRRKSDVNAVCLNFTVEVTRTFYFELPDSLPYDDEDIEDIEDALFAMKLPPSDVQSPVPDGSGGLVCNTFGISFCNDARNDDEIVSCVTKTIRRSLRNRTRLIDSNGHVVVT